MDTDNFILYIKVDDIYAKILQEMIKDFAGDVEKGFDT